MLGLIKFFGAGAIFLSILLAPKSVRADELIACTAGSEFPVRGVALLVHGLNQAPESLAPLAEVLRQFGLHTCRLTLNGHREQDKCRWEVTLESWQRELDQALTHVTTKYPGFPCYGVGNSLGAALLLDKQFRSPKSLQGMVLFAPAIHLTYTSSLVRLLAPLQYFGVQLPSLAPAEHRKCEQTSIGAYRQATRLADSLRALSFTSELTNTPTMVFLAREDELIDFDKTRQYFTETGSPRWQFVELTPNPGRENIPKHAIFSEDSLGTTEWQRVLNILGIRSRS